jgi:pimeloyl-ACP methyl ester carboxylesterase
VTSHRASSGLRPTDRPLAVPATVFDQHDLELDGIRVRYIDEGPTAPDARRGPSGVPSTLLVLPGHTARIEGFDVMVPYLAADHRVLVLDFPGSGYADKPDRDYTLTFYEDIAVGFLDALGIETAVPVGGSLGGNLVLRLGHRFPHRFPRLALWAPGGAWKAKPGLARVTRRFAGERSFWPSVHIQSRFWYARDYPGRQAALAETFAYYNEIMCPGFVKMYWGIAADQLAHSLFDIAPAIEQEALLMWGDEDNGAKMGDGVARLHELLPHNDFHIFHGARHSLETEVPRLLAETINDFLARTATAR